MARDPGQTESDAMRACLAALCLTLCLTAPALADEVTVSGRDLVPVGPFGWAAPRLVLPPPDPALPMVKPKADDPAVGLVQRLAALGRAAGFAGVIYDNRDRGHSSLPADSFPGLARLAYGADLRAAGLDYGLGGAILLPAIVLGNSSTAIRRGPHQRSLPRFAMTTALWPARSFRAYAANQLYVYPEHRDHDAADLYPANWPYMVISQGSSGSDRPFLRALALTLAALPPDTRARMQAEGLVAASLQMILRRGQKQVVTREDYFTGKAHPTVFDAALLDPLRMVGLAAAMRPETLPPMVHLTVLQEDFGLAAGLAGQSERLFTTPSAVARLWRGPEWQHRMVVTARDTRDPNARPLRFRWALLRGDPARVRIEPLDAAGTTARLTVTWQDPGPGAGIGTDAAGALVARSTARVDIGVFAQNGAEDSAPAFVSVGFPAQEVRHYEPAPDGGLRIASVDYDALGRKAAYDPVLFWSAPWRDVYGYDADGRPTGWQRQPASGPASRFDAAGRTVGAAGTPGGDRPAAYRITGAEGDHPTLEMVPAAPNGAAPGAPGDADRPKAAEGN